MIVATAMLVIGKKNQRHLDIMNIKNAGKIILGFVDEVGNFYDRLDASKEAYSSGQISKDEGCLISEDLW